MKPSGIAYQLYRGRALVHQSELRLPADGIKIGSVDTASILLPKEPDVSRFHAAISVEGDELYVIDLGSRCGTFLNDRQVSRERLIPGDRLRFGRSWELRLVGIQREAPAAEPTPEREFEGTAQSLGTSTEAAVIKAQKAAFPGAAEGDIEFDIIEQKGRTAGSFLQFTTKIRVTRVIPAR